MAERVIGTARAHSGKRGVATDPALAQRPARRWRWLPLLLAALALLGWYAATRNDSARFVIASPGAVVREFAALAADGSLLRHIGATGAQIVIGFALGVGVAFLLGYGIARNRFLESLLGPYAVGFQAVPIVAIAPVLIRFFGPGIATNSVIVALIVFFPMLVSTIVGMRSADPDLQALMRSLAATRWQTFTRLEVPSALPSLFGGLKVSTTLAVAASVVGEAISSTAGLGFLVYSSRYVFNPAGVLVGVFTLTALALALYEIVARMERRLLAWQRLQE
jgi:NitT/TauT family transport system permease protein